MLKVCCIIVTNNGMSWIDKCLQSLRDSIYPVHKIVVDNQSKDDTTKHIRINFPEVELIQAEINEGFGQGNNIGLKKALKNGADYIFLLNQDARIEANTIEGLVAVAEKNKEYGIISPFHFNWEGDKVDHFFLKMVNADDCPGFLSDSLLKEQKEIYELKFIHAACWLISKECLVRTGGFDPLFYHYGEDNDYVNRAAIKGFKIGICPHVNVFHYGFFDPSKPLHSNDHLEKISGLLELKTLQNSLIGNYVFFLKRRFDKSTTLLFSRKFSKAFKEIFTSFTFLKYCNKISMSRRASNKESAFL